MAQSSAQLLQWANAELPALKVRLAATYAAIGDTRRRLAIDQGTRSRRPEG
jgi:hypothetical protein